MHCNPVALWNVGWFKLWGCHALVSISSSYPYETSDPKPKEFCKAAWFAWACCGKVHPCVFYINKINLVIFYIPFYKFGHQTLYQYIFRLLSMTPICCLEASSNTSNAVGTSLTESQLSLSVTSPDTRLSVHSSVNQTQANQVWIKDLLIFIFIWYNRTKM